MQQVSAVLGPPERPVPDVKWDDVIFGEISDELAMKLQVSLIPY